MRPLAYLTAFVCTCLTQSQGVIGALLLERAAVDFCAKKVAASSGDARRALEVCRVAADTAIRELKDYEERLLSLQMSQSHPPACSDASMHSMPSPLVAHAGRSSFSRSSTTSRSQPQTNIDAKGATYTPDAVSSLERGVAAAPQRFALRPVLPERDSSCSVPHSIGSAAAPHTAATIPLPSRPATAAASSQTTDSGSMKPTIASALPCVANVQAVNSCIDEQLPQWASEPPIRFLHMREALASAFRSTSVQLLESLPYHQKIILCTMVLRMRRLTKQAEDATAAAAATAAIADAAASAAALDTDGKGVSDARSSQNNLALAPRASAENVVSGGASFSTAGGTTSGQRSSLQSAGGYERCTVSMLAAEYDQLCSKHQLPPLRPQEVVTLCDSLAVCGLLGIGGATGRPSPHEKLSRAVWLTIQQEDLQQATAQLQVFRQMLA